MKIKLLTCALISLSLTVIAETTKKGGERVNQSLTFEVTGGGDYKAVVWLDAQKQPVVETKRCNFHTLSDEESMSTNVALSASVAADVKAILEDKAQISEGKEKGHTGSWKSLTVEFIIPVSPLITRVGSTSYRLPIIEIDGQVSEVFNQVLQEAQKAAAPCTSH